MRICGQEFNASVIQRISGTIEETPAISRRELSRRVCEWMNWRSANGKLKEMSCRKALCVLERQGRIRFVESRKRFSFQKGAPAQGREWIKVAEVACKLRDLGPLEIEMVVSRHTKASKTWNVLMDRYHPLGKGPLCGAQIRYLVHSPRWGYLGAVAFSAASWVLKDRDAAIQWSEKARRANLEKVVCNSRFLICPTVRVANLASYVLSRCLKRLARDWIERYGIEPMLVETFVDHARFSGASYRAANWICVGKTAGRRGSPKAIYLYPLRREWREELCVEPPRFLGAGLRCSEATDWVEEELGSAEIYDPRLKRRMYQLVRDFYEQPQAAIPEACGSLAKTRAAYRLLTNKRVRMETVLRAHVESSLERVRKERVVLAVQDTTSLNYTTHRATEGLGPISVKQSKAVGLIVHDTMAFTEEGTPLGLLDVQCWARDPQDKGKKERRKQTPIEDKESIKWLKSYRAACEVQTLCPDTLIISTGDRESDIYELFLEAAQNPQGAKLLVRCERSRNRKAEGQYLWQRMEREPLSGIQWVEVPRQGCRLPRTAKLEVRHAQVVLKPPKDKPYPPLSVWLVHATEVDSSPAVSPLDWMLLTTVAVNSFEEAAQCLRWYVNRWNIEVYHKTLKSGCRIEDRQLEEAENLETCLMMDMVVAWRIHHLTKLSRETPDVPCSVFFEEAEWRALCAFKTKDVKTSHKEPTLREATRMVASLGGFLGRKRDGEPGTITLWRGLTKLQVITDTYLLFLPHLRAGP